MGLCNHSAVNEFFSVLRILWANRDEKLIQYIDGKTSDLQEARKTGWRAALVTGSNEWLKGFRAALRNSSSYPSTGADNGIPGVARVDTWDGGLGAVC